MSDRRSAARRAARSDLPTGGRAVWIGVAVVVAVVLVAIVAVVATGSGDDTDTAVPHGREAAGAGAVTFETFEGDTRSLSAYEGRPLVVNFFASWCVPCLAELPRFEEVHQSYGDQVAFLGLNLQDSPDAGQDVISQAGITYDVGRDPAGSAFADLGGFGMPTTVFISPAGEIVDLHTGELSGDALDAKIRSELPA